MSSVEKWTLKIRNRKWSKVVSLTLAITVANFIAGLHNLLSNKALPCPSIDIQHNVV